MSNPLKELRLSLEELKAIAEIMSIKGYKAVKVWSKDELGEVGPYSIKTSKKR